MGVRSSAQLAAAAHRSCVASFRKLAEHSPGGAHRTVGPVFAFVSGLPAAELNGCIVVESTPPGTLVAALDWLSDSGLPYRLWLDGPARQLASIGQQHGLEADPWSCPGMVLHPIPEPPPPAAGVSVTPRLEPGVADYVPSSMARDADIRLFTTWLDGHPVGSSIAIRNGDVSSVVAVATRPEARHRGVGTAASWAAAAAGRAWGCDTVALEATEMGHPVYAAMGFRTVAQYATFTARAG